VLIDKQYGAGVAELASHSADAAARAHPAGHGIPTGLRRRIRAAYLDYGRYYLKARQGTLPEEPDSAL
jgi:hypothetical protein